VPRCVLSYRRAVGPIKTLRSRGTSSRDAPDSLLLQAVVTGNPITIFGEDSDTPDGTCIRDYVHVTDLAEAHLLALERLLADQDRMRLTWEPVGAIR
jgi:UDP-glucose 4-epimerase